MTVYVDRAFIPARVGRINSKWCHLMADTTEELMAFARHIGLRPSWIQAEGTVREHFDVTETKRVQAVRAGAVEIDRYAAVDLMRTKRELADLL